MEQTKTDNTEKERNPTATSVEGKKPAALSHTHQDKKKHRTFGNKVFDLTIWPSIQWIGVWLFSLYIGNKAIYGKKKPNEWFKQANQWLTPKLKVFDTPQAKKLWPNTGSKKWAESITMIAALGTGGTLTLPLLKFFEDRRQKISGWFDHLFGKVPPDPDITKREPKQTWASLIAGRASVLSMAYLIAGALGPHRLGVIQEKFAAPATEKFLKLKPQSKKPGVSPEQYKKDVKDWTYLAVYDLIYSAAVAGIHYGVSRFTATKKEAKTVENKIIDAAIEKERAVEGKEKQAVSKEKETDEKQLPATKEKPAQSWTDKKIAEREEAVGRVI